MFIVVLLSVCIYGTVKGAIFRSPGWKFCLLSYYFWLKPVVIQSEILHAISSYLKPVKFP